MIKVKKFFYTILICLIIIPCMFIFTGCTNTASIISFEKTDTNGLIDTYTVTYSDGKTETFTVTNGANGTNGQNGNDLEILDVYNEYVTRYGEITFEEFLDLFLDFNLNDNTLTIQKLLRSTLKVYCEFYETSNLWLEESKDVTMSSGSAIVYKIEQDYTYILTNYHVVYSAAANSDNGGNIARKIVGYLYGSEDTPGKTTETNNGYAIYNYGDYAIDLTYVGGTITYDLAILKVETNKIKAVNPNVCAVEVAENYYVGETAIAIGNAEDQGISVTQGVVSVDSENVDLQIGTKTRSYRSLRIDTAIYHGNSGGGLFNKEGKLIGITNAGDNNDQNINYAIPLQIVKNVFNNIMFYYNDNNAYTNGVYKTTIGFYGTTKNSKYIYDQATGYGKIVEDVVVDEVIEDTIATILNLQAGDIIKYIYINNVENVIERDFNINDVMLTVKAGDVIKIGYVRGEETKISDEYEIEQLNLVSIE